MDIQQLIHIQQLMPIQHLMHIEGRGPINETGGGGHAAGGERTATDQLDPRNVEGGTRRSEEQLQTDCRWAEELLNDIEPNEVRGQLMGIHLWGKVLRREPKSLPPPVAGRPESPSVGQPLDPDTRIQQGGSGTSPCRPAPPDDRLD